MDKYQDRKKTLTLADYSNIFLFISRLLNIKICSYLKEII